MFIEWVRKNGSKITTNDLKATVLHAESLGWVRVEEAEETKEVEEAEETELNRNLRLINGFTDKNLLGEHMKNNFDINLDKRGDIETVIRKACELVSESLEALDD